MEETGVWQKADLSTGPKLLGIRSTGVKGKYEEDLCTYSDSRVGPAVDGIRPDNYRRATDDNAGASDETQTTAPVKGKKMRPAQDQNPS